VKKREKEKKKYEIFQRKQPGEEEEEVERENGPAAGGADHAPRLQLGRVLFRVPDGRRRRRENLDLLLLLFLEK
jgi:hypothetical protein